MTDLTAEQAAALWTYDTHTWINDAVHRLHPDATHLTDDELATLASLLPAWFNAVATAAGACSPAMPGSTPEQ